VSLADPLIGSGHLHPPGFEDGAVVHRLLRRYARPLAACRVGELGAGAGHGCAPADRWWTGTIEGTSVSSPGAAKMA
jgi:hypothetical protein